MCMGSSTTGRTFPEALPSAGDDVAEVDLASYGKLSALVSEVKLSRPLGTREDLLAHDEPLPRRPRGLPSGLGGR